MADTRKQNMDNNDVSFNIRHGVASGCQGSEDDVVEKAFNIS